MHLPTDRGVPLEERQKLAFGGLADWDAARVFLEVARYGSFRSTAERLGLSINVWLSYHPGSGRMPRIRSMIDWLVEAFNPARFPWFADEFVHPREFDAVYMGDPPTHLFGGFPTEGR